ncbi:hypothetical protein CDAR_403171 [Caerostris darwini]|uniref:Uncharacterized protein n=1 Tax=Caerostris darwini TaxID=1538125 RepID=A0AAV4X0Q9_9ARAC|nr:hypothetical protein CDAR_403171 [Caerostris darwini]
MSPQDKTLCSSAPISHAKHHLHQNDGWPAFPKHLNIIHSSWYFHPPSYHTTLSVYPISLSRIFSKDTWGWGGTEDWKANSVWGCPQF